MSDDEIAAVIIVGAVALPFVVVTILDLIAWLRDRST